MERAPHGEKPYLKGRIHSPTEDSGGESRQQQAQARLDSGGRTTPGQTGRPLCNMGGKVPQDRRPSDRRLIDAPHSPGISSWHDGTSQQGFKKDSPISSAFYLSAKTPPNLGPTEIGTPETR